MCDNPDSVLLFKNKYIFLILSTLFPTKILTLYFMFKHKYIVKQQLTNLISIQKDLKKLTKKKNLIYAKFIKKYI